MGFVAIDFPGALDVQWITMDRRLWRIENYPNFCRHGARYLLNPQIDS